jgi:hypothetical protein
VKSAMILAAFCAALCVSTPAAQAIGPTDNELFCKFFPLTAKCTAPAKPAPVKPAMKVAAAKPAATPKLGIKMLSCVKAPADKPYLYTCVWK